MNNNLRWLFRISNYTERQAVCLTSGLSVFKLSLLFCQFDSKTTEQTETDGRMAAHVFYAITLNKRKTTNLQPAYRLLIYKNYF